MTSKPKEPYLKHRIGWFCVVTLLIACCVIALTAVTAFEPVSNHDVAVHQVQVVGVDSHKQDIATTSNSHVVSLGEIEISPPMLLIIGLVSGTGILLLVTMIVAFVLKRRRKK